MPALFLYEPRMLPRTLVTRLVDAEHSAIPSFQSLPYLTEKVCASKADNKLLLAGVAGAGTDCMGLLRFIRNLKSFKVKTLIWVPTEYPWLFKLLNAICNGKIIQEEELVTILQPTLKELVRSKPVTSRQSNGTKHPRRITLTELDILLQFASGLSSREMAECRSCSYKTIFSWKHNICEALNIESHAQWLEMLTEIVQLSSMYRAGENNGAL